MQVLINLNSKFDAMIFENTFKLDIKIRSTNVGDR